MWHPFKEIMHELREIGGTLKRLEHSMSLDFSKLQAADAALAAEVQALAQTITDESTKIQAAIDALAAASGSTPADQAAIDQVTADLTSANTNLQGAVTSVQGLPTTPTPAAPSGQ